MLAAAVVLLLADATIVFTRHGGHGRPSIPVNPHGPVLAGVTVDDTTNLDAIVAAVRHLPRRPVVRIVFDIDPHHPAATDDWTEAVDRLSAVATVMGELADSDEVKAIDVDAMRARTEAFVRAFGSKVAIWEIGNEVNGNWVGPRSVIAAKTIAAYDVVHAAGGKTALTLYENTGCGDGADELSPAAWSQEQLPPEMRAGLDYVFLSYYEDECHQLRPSLSEWQQRFDGLHALFPNARLGFGEIGMTDAASGRTREAARSLLEHYYSLDVPVPGWVGGYFWWYFAEDMVPRSKPLYVDLVDAFARGYA